MLILRVCIKEEWPVLTSGALLLQLRLWNQICDPVYLLADLEKSLHLRVLASWFTNWHRVVVRMKWIKGPENSARCKGLKCILVTSVSLVPRTVSAHSGYSIRICWINKRIFPGTKIQMGLLVVVKAREVLRSVNKMRQDELDPQTLGIPSDQREAMCLKPVSSTMVCSPEKFFWSCFGTTLGQNATSAYDFKRFLPEFMWLFLGAYTGLKSVPLNSCLPGISECDLIWK